jgi:AraC-like DNA-binding protein
MAEARAKVLRLPPPSDPLGEALSVLRMSGAFYCRTQLSAPAGLLLPPMGDCISFHVVISGQCLLNVEGQASVGLVEGDVALVPHGRGHCLLTEASSSAANIFELPHEYESDRYALLRHGPDAGQLVELVCGAVQFGHPNAPNLAAELPPVIHMGTSQPHSPSPEGMPALLQLMAVEARQLRAGGETVVARLCDVLVIQAIRSWMESDAAQHAGWVGALHDPLIGGVLAALHRHPERDWTLASMAAHASMSRSVFSERFSDLVGQPAMQYLAMWRMGIALDQLKTSQLGIGDIAAKVGYSSEASFSRAFKRIRGVAPSVARVDADSPLLRQTLK